MHWLLRLVVLGAVVTGLTASAPTFAALSGVAGSRLTVVATNLNNPRKLFLGRNGAVYVVEAGTGGSDKCFGTGANAICVGLSGSITRIANGTQRRVVTRLPSWATAYQQRAQGAADVLLRGSTYYVLVGDAVANVRGGNDLGPDGAIAGHLVATPPGQTAPRSIADLARFEAAHNPDHGAGPGAKLGDPAIDSNPYALTPYRGGFAVVDAGANDLLWISPTGTISLLAVFPTQTEKLTKAVATRIGAPSSLRSLVVQSVPSCVAAGPDGALYVGELTGRPFQPGAARVWRVVPGQKPTLYASGFTNISDLAFDGKDILVLELADKGLYDPKSTGALVRLAPNGTRTTVASAGLVDPTGLAIGNGRMYISNYGFFAGAGPGPHGEVVSLPLRS